MVMRGIRSACSLRGLLILVVLAGLGLGLIGAGIYALTSVWPGVGAQSIEVLRQIIGNEAVATVESFVFEVQDQLHQWQYQIGGGQAQALWAVAATPIAYTTATHLPTVPQLAAKLTPTPPSRQTTGLVDAPAQVTLPPAPPVWQPAPVPPYGTIAGEGQWSAYLTDSATGRVVAYRTFLQPDATRPYAVVSVVVFDLEAIRLHFVLGLEEPRSTVVVQRSGVIPEADRQLGVLLAAFNGGFKAEHGHFGVGVRGITVLPPRQDFSTVAIYSDGRVQLGAWGTEITPSPDIIAWRQNGPLLVHNGEINPHTTDNAPQDWGYTVKGETATWRSALGLSADGRNLYYAAGPSLTLPVLAKTMLAAGAAQAMQLDINPYWTHFDAFVADGVKLRPEPLVPAMGSKAEDRYLKAYARDFFYVTLNK
jgi:hypothetical protein